MRSINRIGSFWIGTLLLISFSVISCSIIDPPTLVQVIDTKVEKFSTKEIAVEVTLKIKNPNNFNIKVTKSNLDIFLNDALLGTALNNNKICLKKESTENHKILLSMSNSQLSKNALSMIMGATLGGKMDIRVKGYIKGKAMMISKKVPIEFSHKMM